MSLAGTLMLSPTVPDPSNSWWRRGSATIAYNSAAGASTSTDRLTCWGPASTTLTVMTVSFRLSDSARSTLRLAHYGASAKFGSHDGDGSNLAGHRPDLVSLATSSRMRTPIFAANSRGSSSWDVAAT